MHRVAVGSAWFVRNVSDHGANSAQREHGEALAQRPMFLTQRTTEYATVHAWKLHRGTHAYCELLLRTSDGDPAHCPRRQSGCGKNVGDSSLAGSAGTWPRGGGAARS